MRLAIISVTNCGSILARKLAHSLPYDVTVFYKMGCGSEKTGCAYDNINLLVEKLFIQYDGIIFIMATGIVVRVIAPFVNDKRFDPAVVVLDDQGKNVISLLSGHIGGANDLTWLISKVIGANAVITTATDIAGKPAADLLAVKLGLAIEPFANLKLINGAIINNKTVLFFVDFNASKYRYYKDTAKQLGIELKDISLLNNIDFDAAVLITDKFYKLDKLHLYLRQPNLAVGIGCRRGIPQHVIWQAVNDACSKIGRSMQSITAIGSTTLKSNEEGLLKFAAKIGVPVSFFSNQDIMYSIEKYKLTVSVFVEKEIGVGNVCEAAALLAGKTNKLLLPKTKYQGVTVAIAEVK